MSRSPFRFFLAVSLVAVGAAAGVRAEMVEVDPTWPSVGPKSKGQYVRTLRPVLRETEIVDSGIVVPPPLSAFRTLQPGPVAHTALPTIGFTGVDGTGKSGFFDDLKYKPADTHVAVGTGTGTAGRIVMVTNGGIQIWDKTGTSLAGPQPLSYFIGVARGDAFDPRVIFDRESERFFIVILEGSEPNPNGSSWIHVIVSTSATPSDLGNDPWERMVDSALTRIDTFDTWLDYPSVGADDGSLFVTGNLFDGTDTFRGVKIRVYDKDDLLAGTSTFTDLDESDATTPGIGTVQPANVLGPNGTTDSGDFYLVNRMNSTNYRFWQITGAPASPSIVTNGARTWTAGAFLADGAPQSGSPIRLDTSSPRILDAVYRAGEIWLALTSDMDSDDRSEVFWARLETNGVSPGIQAIPTLADSGYLDGSGSGAWTFVPAIAVNAAGQAAITYTESSASQFADMRYVARSPSDPAGTFQEPIVAKTSVGAYDAFDNDDPERWGDYAAMVVDPANDADFCAASEFVQTSGTDTSIWGTYIACFEPSTAETLSILAKDDVPATAGGGSGVHVVVEAKDCGDRELVAPIDLYWDEDDNEYRAQSVTIPLTTKRIRFTFKDDYCGVGCPQDVDADRNAHIDKFTFGNELHEAEDYTRTDGTDPDFPGGCGKSTDPHDSSRKVAVCSHTNDFVEYDLVSCRPGQVPTLSEWGTILLVLLLAACGAACCAHAQRSPSGSHT